MYQYGVAGYRATEPKIMWKQQSAVVQVTGCMFTMWLGKNAYGFKNVLKRDGRLVPRFCVPREARSGENGVVTAHLWVL